MQHPIETGIDIAAPPGTVWAHLTDLASYAEWNPFIPSAAGTAAVGARLSMRLQPPGGRALPIRPEVTEVVPGEVFEWLGHLGVPGLFDGRHRFELTAVPSGTRLVQSESFSGLLVRPLKGFLDGATLAGFREMDAALARRSERTEPAP
ncbi:SRPBCC domain-containing protein [Blastococcus sp. MG754426]|uniref:SRPBCC domain-containing protein n=1 Tax=unclassified Blastococcus TaxID=2619396 RepID=UPI001EEFE225|nr:MULTISPECIES: SRPBCC domain-containing protein [unclassified Blastococcus]MCF6509067.1 SRPBCC domain-containing protein [Blastococcus sp. MG754426]MCF6513685.1 SRPBCC domain-containing protein [Blastococcus sp. MG754427]MCF6734219.1 SRPBCC domain-containing protein [Blastococcus sp. KM273129]